MTDDVNFETLVDDVLRMIRQIARNPADVITPSSDILIEIDFDSLQLLELTTVLKERYEVDFLELPGGMRELRNAETIAAAVLRELQNVAAE